MMSQAARRFCSSALRRGAADDVHPVYFKIKDVQKQYQVNDGRLIHERHGTMGKVLHGITGVVFVVCMAQTLMVIGRCLKPLFIKAE